VILAADFGAKQAYWWLTGQKHREKPVHREASRLFHHGLKPMTSHEDQFGPLRSRYYINSLGMRDASCREVSRQSDQPRLLLVGDSFVEGVGVSWEQSMAGRLAVDLAKRGVEVLNAGVASYAPAVYDAWVTHLIREQALQVDRVAVFIDISDIKDEYHYERQADGTIRQKTFGPVGEAGPQMARAQCLLDWVETYIEGQFVLIGALSRNLRLAWMKSRWVPWYVRAKEEMPTWAYDWGEYQGPYQAYVEEGLKKAKASMDRLAEFLRERRIPLTVVVYPWPAQIQRGREDSRVVTEWRDWAKSRGVDFVSLFPLMIRAGPADEVIRKYHNVGDAHWNPEGNALVAEYLLSPGSGFAVPRGVDAANSTGFKRTERPASQ